MHTQPTIIPSTGQTSGRVVSESGFSREALEARIKMYALQLASEASSEDLRSALMTIVREGARGVFKVGERLDTKGVMALCPTAYEIRNNFGL